MWLVLQNERHDALEVRKDTTLGTYLGSTISRATILSLCATTCSTLSRRIFD